MKNLQTGDLGMIRSKGFVPYCIRGFMRLYVKRFRKTKLDKYYNHMFSLFYYKGVLMCAEAKGKGFVVKSLEKSYTEKELSKRVVFVRLNKEMNKKEKQAFSDKIINMAFNNVEYEFTNFIKWAAYILTWGKWDKIKKSDEKKVFCFESATLHLNAARKMFKNPAMVTTVDYQLDDRFKKFTL